MRQKGEGGKKEKRKRKTNEAKVLFADLWTDLPSPSSFSTMHDDLKDSRTKRNIKYKKMVIGRGMEMAALIRFSLRIDSLFVY